MTEDLARFDALRLRAPRLPARPSLRMIVAWGLVATSIPTLIGWFLAVDWTVHALARGVGL